MLWAQDQDGKAPRTNEQCCYLARVGRGGVDGQGTGEGRGTPQVIRECEEMWIQLLRLHLL